MRARARRTGWGRDKLDAVLAFGTVQRTPHHFCSLWPVIGFYTLEDGHERSTFITDSRRDSQITKQKSRACNSVTVTLESLAVKLRRLRMKATKTLDVSIPGTRHAQLPINNQGHALNLPSRGNRT